MEGTGAQNPPHNLNAAHCKAFITDQFVYLRHTCAIPIGTINDIALYEKCFLRLLCFKHRLIAPTFDPANFHVIYNDYKISDPTVVGSVLHRVRAEATYAADDNGAATWMNLNRPRVRRLVNAFSNIVCIVGYVFRQKGHHYRAAGEYNATYQRIRAKLHKDNQTFTAAWENLSTTALHAIMPAILDGYWTLYENDSRIAPPLQLRYVVPTAVYALVVGWQDAQNVYGILLQSAHASYQRLLVLLDACKNNRWRHGINAIYYGADPTRLDMSPYASLAATVVSVYESAAENATLLQSKSLNREATCAPLQRDISSMAARAIKTIFVKSLAGRVVNPDYRAIQHN